MKRSLVAVLSIVVLVGCSTIEASSTTTSAPDEPSETSATLTENAGEASATPLPSQAAEIQQRSITVGGVGSEYTSPDRCVVELSAVSRRDTVNESAQAASASGDAIRAALAEAGVAAADIQTTDFSIGPTYGSWYNDVPEITGYETRIGYRVTLSDVDNVGSILAGAITAGGDEVNAYGIRFEADPEPLMEAARAQAWADVEARATSLADLAGVTLGGVLDAHEKVLITSPQGMTYGGEGDSASFEIPVSPGVSGVVILMTVTFEIS